MNDLSTQIGALVAEGKFEEAKSLLKEAAGQDLSPEEEGEQLAKFAEAYLEAATSVNEMRIKSLEAGLEALNSIRSEESAAISGSKLDAIKRRLGLSK